MNHTHLIPALICLVAGVIAVFLGGIGAADPEGRGGNFAFLMLAGALLAVGSALYLLYRLAVYLPSIW